MDNESEINKLFKRLDNLLQRQDELSNDIVNLRKELRDIKDSKENKARTSEEKFSFTTVKPLKSQNSSLHVSQSNKSNIEKFIGENLISKIGVVITIIGVFIGIKYTIEKDLISPLSRILLGYLFGLVFLLFGVKLKKRFKNFSAVLVSGGISITYFVTFSAYNYYNLIPQSITFILLFICTVFAVFSAIKFNTQIIALIGLVGAYAVPFLLSNNSGNVSFLFSYISIINIGILFISFKKYWKSLFYCSFLITWLILIFWFVSEYQESLYFSLTLTFSLIFFLVFYATSLSFKLIKNERFGFESIVLLLANSLIFYSIGFAVLSDHEIGKQLLGAFTLGNSILHIGIGAVIYKINGVDKNFFLLVTGIALIFITIAIPVELNGNWVTLLWAGEGTLLFWIGRTKKTWTYEKLSYILMFLAFFSLLHDWVLASEIQENIPSPIFNIDFFASLMFIGFFGFIILIGHKMSSANSQNQIANFMSYTVLVIFLVSIYYTFRFEIEHYWNQLYQNLISSSESKLIQNKGQNLIELKKITTLDYSLLFVSLLSFINIYQTKSKRISLANILLNIIVVGYFLTQGLLILRELRIIYFSMSIFQDSTVYFFVRYVSYALVGLVLLACKQYVDSKMIKDDFKIPIELIVMLTILWILSSELVNQLAIYGKKDLFKLEITILWGVFSMILVVLGIWKVKKHLRVMAIVLFGVTLIKLFIYDISHLNTVSKTIVFVALGVLLLIISFLYNKYRHIISEDEIK